MLDFTYQFILMETQNWQRFAIKEVAHSTIPIL